MAELDLTSLTNLQNAPHVCANCSTSETAGSPQSISGDFRNYFNNLLKDSLSNNGGKDLPNDGNNLPLENTLLKSNPEKIAQYLPIQGLKIGSLETQLNLNTSENAVNQAIFGLSDEAVESIFNVVSEGLNEDPSNLPLQLENIFKQEGLSLEASAELTTLVKELYSQIESLPELRQLIAKVNDDFSTISQTGITTAREIGAISSNALSALPDPFLNQINQSDISSFNNLSLEKQLNNISINNESVKLSGFENKVDDIYISDKLQDVLTKNISGNTLLENIIKDKNIQADNINHLNPIRLETGSYSTNLTNIENTYNYLNVNSSQNRNIESPIPILVRQNASLEQVQQDVEQSIAENIKWLINNKVQNAKINIYPESLGQVNIALNLEDSNLKLNFIASANATKELIEAGIANLRNQFHETGIHLQEVNVGTYLSQQQEEKSQFSDLKRQASNQNEDVSNPSADNFDSKTQALTQTSSNLLHILDAYA